MPAFLRRNEKEKNYIKRRVERNAPPSWVGSRDFTISSSVFVRREQKQREFYPGAEKKRIFEVKDGMGTGKAFFSPI